MQIEGQTAYLLHLRKYTDSRVILELLTQYHGRVSAVYRLGLRDKKGSPPQSFTPLHVSWKGLSGLKTLFSVEPYGRAIPLYSERLYCALYLNELLYRVLPQEDPCQSVFDLYIRALAELAQEQRDASERECTLRTFELSLLQALGFEINFDEDVNQNPIAREKSYTYMAGEGFVLANLSTELAFSADIIEAIRQRNFSDTLVRRYAKYLCRSALSPLLGGRPLKSRDFFR